MKHMVSMDLQPITSIPGEGEEGIEARRGAFYAAVRAHHWKFRTDFMDSGFVLKDGMVVDIKSDSIDLNVLDEGK